MSLKIRGRHGKQDGESISRNKQGVKDYRKDLGNSLFHPGEFSRKSMAFLVRVLSGDARQEY
jgi:hypothetical protein